MTSDAEALAANLQRLEEIKHEKLAAKGRALRDDGSSAPMAKSATETVARYLFSMYPSLVTVESIAVFCFDCIVGDGPPLLPEGLGDPQGQRPCLSKVFADGFALPDSEEIARIDVTGWVERIKERIDDGDLPKLKSDRELCDMIQKCPPIAMLCDRRCRLHPDNRRPKTIGIDAEHFTEGGNATRFQKLHGDRVRFDHARRRWLIWNGAIWEPDTDGEIMRLAGDVVKYLYGLASESDDPDFRKAIATFARSSDRTYHLRNFLELAKNRLGIATTAEKLDCDKWLATAGDVTIDLRTLEVRDPDPADMITKRLATTYDPSTTCPRWEQFLKEIFGGDEELVRYVQRAVGYSLTGSMAEQCFFFLHGAGANGKSTFLAVLTALLGDYAKHATFSTFLAQRTDRIRNDLAALSGARVIIAGEAEEGNKFSMAVIKPFVGGDPVTARFLFAEDFTFKPEGKLWLAANTKPTITDRTYAAWRRVHLIPFNVTFEKETQDVDLESKLLSELPGVLNWALEGLKDYHIRGLAPPKAVIAATNEYRRENDSLQDFIGEICVVGPEYSVKNSELYAAYLDFCQDSGHEALSQKKFSTEVKRAPGITSTKDWKTGRYWHGIALTDQSVTADGLKKNAQSFSCKASRMQPYAFSNDPSADSDQPVSNPSVGHNFTEKPLHQASEKQNSTQTKKSDEIGTVGITDDVDGTPGREEDHPQEDGPPKPVCEVCGADLTSKGRVVKNGKFYCAKPGCGYPPRAVYLDKEGW